MDPETKKITRSRDIIFLENFRYGEAENPGILELNDDSEQQEGHQERNAGREAKEDRREVDEEIDSDASSEYSEYLENEDQKDEKNAQTKEIPPLRRSSRTPKSVNMEDYVTYLTFSNEATDPQSVEEALNLPDRERWIKAMEEERDSLAKNNTWFICRKTRKSWTRNGCSRSSEIQREKQNASRPGSLSEVVDKLRVSTTTKRIPRWYDIPPSVFCAL